MLIEPKEYSIMDFVPRKDTEENLKFRFCRHLESYGFKFFSQYPSRWNEAPGCRFDIVVHDDKYIYALIEIKRKSRNPARGNKWLKSRQAAKYLSFGIPVFLVYNDADFTPTMNDLTRIQHEFRARIAGKMVR